MTPTTTDPLRRAFAAYYRAAGEDFDQPSSLTSDLAEVDGLQYAVLRNVNGILAVYRVLPNGVLKRLRRWPAALAT